MFDLGEFADILDEDEFDERPVLVEEFVQSPDYLGLKVTLSREQYAIIKMSTQVYRKETLIKLYGQEKGQERWEETFQEVIMMLGKGSGKDFCSTIACAYLVYLLLCLKDPHEYYGVPTGDAIDIINVAINADQANNVFFKGMVERIRNSPWFQGKYLANGDGRPAKAGVIEFNKQITLYSGHSEREAFEGYNAIFVVLDEIAGFSMDNNSGNKLAKTAEEVYKTYSNIVTSRYPKHGKILLLSFPRYKGDFITQRYDEVVGDKTTIMKQEIVKINEDLPDGIEGNEVIFEWEHDIIERYQEPGVFAMRRASWEVNPTKTPRDYLRPYMRDPLDTMSRFACMPPEAIDAFFKNQEIVKEAFVLSNGVDDDGTFRASFQPKPDTNYYVHVDLAKKHDRCAVSLAHVDSWKQIKIGESYSEPAPVVIVDCIRWWSPTSLHNVDFGEVRDYIISLRQRGFNLKLVTFDRWRSDDIIEELKNVGIRAAVLSVAKQHYQDLAMLIGDRRILGPAIDLLTEELFALRITRDNKVDHPRSGYKDLSDALTGSVYNAIVNTSRRDDEEIEVYTLKSFNKDHPEVKPESPKPDGIIRPPKAKMPPEVEQFLKNMSLI